MSDTQSERRNSIKVDHSSDDIEFIIDDIGGSFGKFQLCNYVFYLIAIIMSGIFALSYVFAGLNLDYRCRIPECDDMNSPEYKTDWLENVVPITNLKPSRCYRYEQIHSNDSHRHFLQHDPAVYQIGVCAKDAYNRSALVRCDQDGLVYKTNEVSIMNEFNLTCEENEYKLAMIGTYNNIARFLFMPVVGLLSDRYGRKFMLILGLTMTSLIGWLQSLSTGYTMFAVLEFLAATTAAGIYPAAFILSVEWASKEHRVTTSQLISSGYHFGIALNGVIAAYAHEFRLYLRIIFTFGLVVAVIINFSDESLRWLLTRGKRQPIDTILKKVAKSNDRQLSSTTFEIVQRKCERKSNETINEPTEASIDNRNSLKHIFMSRQLLFRFAISSFSWVAGTFVQHGMSIISVSLHGDRYLSFILVALASVPSGVCTIIILKYLGRPRTIALCFFIAGSAILSAKLLPPGYEFSGVICFMVGKLFVTTAFNTIYAQTAEIWPTNLRHRMMALSSTVGRIGSIMAPLTPLLANITETLPYFTFAAVSLLCCVLILFLPETRDVALPENIEQAKNLGKKRKESV